MGIHSSEATHVDDTYPMVLIGRDHRVSYANPRAHQLFGHEHGRLYGLSVEQLLAPSQRSEVRNVQAVLRGQPSRRWRSIARHADGSLMDVNLALEPCLDRQGGVVAVKLRCERILRSNPPLIQVPAGNAAVRPEVTSGTRPIPAHSERVLAVRPPPSDLILSDDGAEQLESALQLLLWLRQHLEASEDSVGNARTRARALIVLHEATDLVAQCRTDSQRAARGRHQQP